MCRLILVSILFAVPALADTVTIQQDVTLKKRRSTRASTVMSIEAGETAEVLREKDGWVKLRVRGKTGWISQESLAESVVDLAEAEPAATPVVAAIEEPEPEQEPVDDPAASIDAVIEDDRPANAFDVEVAAGLTVMTQGFRTKGGTTQWPDNYNVGVTAATVALSVGYLHRGDDINYGVDVAYTYQKALPGMRHTDPETGEAVITAFSIHDVNARIIAGAELSRASGLAVYARAGVRYHLFQVAGVLDPAANPARIPSEVQLAPTVGASIEISRITDKLGLAIALDSFIVGGKTTQTNGLEDGVGASATGGTLQSTVTYRWRPTLDVRATYELGITMLDFGAPDPMSARMHTGTSVERFDVAHAITLGLAKGF